MKHKLHKDKSHSKLDSHPVTKIHFKRHSDAIFNAIAAFKPAIITKPTTVFSSKKVSTEIPTPFTSLKSKVPEKSKGSLNTLSSVAMKHSMQSDVLQTELLSEPKSTSSSKKTTDGINPLPIKSDEHCASTKRCIALVKSALRTSQKNASDCSHITIKRTTLKSLLRLFDVITRDRIQIRQNNEALVSSMRSQLKQTLEAHQSRFLNVLDRMQSSTPQGSNVASSFAYVDNLQVSLRGLLSSRPVVDNSPVDCIHVPLMRWIAE